MNWDPVDGMILRSQRIDKINFERSKSKVDFNFTSIIVDA